MLSRGAIRDGVVGGACQALGIPFRIGSSSRRDRSPVARVVVVKPAALGDVLMATAALRALRQALPTAHLAVAVSSWARPAVAGNPAIDVVLDLGRVGSGRYNLAEYRTAIRLLREGQYDAALVLDRAPLITLLPCFAGIPNRVGLDSGGRGFSLTSRVPCKTSRHEADLYLDVVQAAGYGFAEPRLQFVPSQDDLEHVDALSTPSSCSPSSGGPLIVVHPGGGVNPGLNMPAKRWPLERFAKLVNRLNRELNARVVIVGGPNERALVSELKLQVNVPAIDLAGALSWGQLGALLVESDLLVANDTGAAHLAVAVGTPAVVLFGPTDEAQYGPYGGLGEAVANHVRCRPCFRNGRFPPCQFDRRCLNELDLELVWAAILRQTAKARRVCGRAGEPRLRA